MDTLQEVVIRSRLQGLLQQHRELDAAIEQLQSDHAADALQLRRLKKQKLDLKDKIMHLENLLIPDIIA